MQSYALTGWNDQLFRLTLDMTQWAAAYPTIAQAKFVARFVDAAKLSGNPASVAVAVGFSSDHADSVAGTATYDPVALKLQLVAPQSAMARMVGAYQGVVQMIPPGSLGAIDICGGTLTMNQGVP